MRAALLLFPVINHQSGKQILQIHPYIHFLYTRIFLFPYPLFIVHSYALLIFYHVLLHIPGLCLPKFPALVNCLIFLKPVSYSSFRSLIDSVYHELQKCASTVYTNPVKKHNNH